MRAAALALATVLVASTRDARAQRPAGASVAASPSPPAAPGSLLGRLGTDAAARLMRSGDPAERLRGVERAAATHTPESLALLERAAGTDASQSLDLNLPAEGIARTDPRALLAVVRGLAAWSGEASARSSLAALAEAPTESFAFRVSSAPTRDPAGDEGDGAARVQLARREAAVALAASGSALAVEALVAMARSSGPGHAAALEALALHPPSAPLALAGVALTTPATIALASGIGDLRALDAILGALQTSDPALRAAAIAALGAAGDMRAIDASRTALGDEDPRVRLAGAEALVHLNAPDAAGAIAKLAKDDATAVDALRLARSVQSDDVTRAAIARTAPGEETSIREAAVSALGAQSSDGAMHALAELATDPVVGGDAVAAIARSPGRGAMATLERLARGAQGGAARRLAARGYLVRRLARGDRSAPLDELLRSLASAADVSDRALGVQSLVALGERTVAAALADADTRVRRAAVLGAMAGWAPGSGEPLLARMAVEPDAGTRAALALGWADASARADGTPTAALIDLARAGGPDAPLAATALARRGGEGAGAATDALLAGRDPVLRAHAARGLGASEAADADGRLERAYAWEGADEVRRAIVGALASAAASGARSEASTRTLELAARLDPDRGTRWMAQRALEGRGPVLRSPVREVAWLRLRPADGAPAMAAAQGFLVRSDGLAVPVSFDDDGYALVPGVPPGEALLRLAPSGQPYSARAP